MYMYVYICNISVYFMHMYMYMFIIGTTFPQMMLAFGPQGLLASIQIFILLSA